MVRAFNKDSLSTRDSDFDGSKSSEVEVLVDESEAGAKADAQSGKAAIIAV